MELKEIQVFADTIVLTGPAALKRDFITGAVYWEVPFKVIPSVVHSLLKICKAEVDDVAFKLGIGDPYHWAIYVFPLKRGEIRGFIQVSVF